MRGLTTRGRSFLAAAAAAGISAFILGERDLLRVAILLAALPLLAAAYVGRSRYKLACTRSLEPGRAPVGSNARVILRLQNMSRLPTGTLLLEDRLPYALGSRPRVVLERLGPHQASSVAYTVRADVRGRYPVGPLVIRLTDPFGLCELNRSFPSVDRLIVIPQVVPLPMVRLAGEYAGTGDSRARSVAVHGEDDAATREYRRGDDLRRVHWRSTARTGELMVRREEQPWESRATVVLDTRAYAHRGEGPTASFEWAVSATASIAMHLRQAGYKLRLVTGTGVDVDATEVGGDGDHPGHPGRREAGRERRHLGAGRAGPPALRRRPGDRAVRQPDGGRGRGAQRAARQRRDLHRLRDRQHHLGEPHAVRPDRGGPGPAGRHAGAGAQRLAVAAGGARQRPAGALAGRRARLAGLRVARGDGRDGGRRHAMTPRRRRWTGRPGEVRGDRAQASRAGGGGRHPAGGRSAVGDLRDVDLADAVHPRRRADRRRRGARPYPAVPALGPGAEHGRRPAVHAHLDVPQRRGVRSR